MFLRQLWWMLSGYVVCEHGEYKYNGALRRHIAYLKYVIAHKYHVYRAGKLIGVPVLQLIVHDWSKFLPREWFAYAETFYNKDGSEKEYKSGQESPEFKKAWRFHQITNKHHWQYWILVWDRAEWEALPMPVNDALEMVADWSGAGMAIAGNPDPKIWYAKNYQNVKVHQTTRDLINDIIANTEWERLL